jgi:hypothetical protein
MMRSLVVAAGVLVLGAAPARTQDSVAALTRDPDANAELAKIIEATRAQGLPVAPILDKVQYAMVVHAPPQRIVAAARAIAARLPIARDALLPRATPADIIAGEVALSYDVSTDAIKSIRQASSEPSIAVPLGVLTELVASKVPAKRASEIVLTLLKHGASGQQLAAMEKTVTEDVRSGLTAEQALELRMNGLNAVLAPSAGQGAAGAVPNNGAALPPRKP